MRSRAVEVLLGFLAVILWIGVLVLVNRKPPTVLNQAVFLLLWGGAVTCSAIPVAFEVQERLSYRATSRRPVMPGRAGRQGVLVGLFATALMALRLLGMLNVLLAVFLLLVTVIIEMLGCSRETF